MDGGGDNQLTVQYFQNRQYRELLRQRIAQNRRRLLAGPETEDRQADGVGRAGEAGADAGIVVGLGADVGAGDGIVGDLDFANAGEHFRAWHELTLHEDSGFESGSEGD